MHDIAEECALLEKKKKKLEKVRPMSGCNGRIRSQPFVYEHTH